MFTRKGKKVFGTILIVLAVVLVLGFVIKLAGGMRVSTEKLPGTELDLKEAVTVSGTSKYSNDKLLLKPGSTNSADLKLKVQDAGIYRLNFKLTCDGETALLVGNEDEMGDKFTMNGFDPDGKTDADDRYTVVTYVYLNSGVNHVTLRTTEEQVNIHTATLKKVTGVNYVALGGTATQAVSADSVDHSGLQEGTGAMWLNANRTAADAIATDTFNIGTKGTYHIGLLGNGEGGFKIKVYDGDGDSYATLTVDKDFTKLCKTDLYSETEGMAIGWADTGLTVKFDSIGEYYFTVEPLSGSGNYINYLGITLTK